jgi:hypothetical protein
MEAETAESPIASTAFRRVFEILLFVALLAAVYVKFAPLEFSMPGYGADPSWMAVREASAHGWRLGRDIIFTSGPLAALYTRWFQPDRLGAYLAAYFILIVTFASLVAAVARRSDRLAAAFLAAFGVALYPFRDAFFVALPLLTSLVILSPRRETLEKAGTVFGLFCCALATLAKFLVAPAALATFILCDIASLVRRSLPIYILDLPITHRNVDGDGVEKNAVQVLRDRIHRREEGTGRAVGRGIESEIDVHVR